jgi:hypothetical protein
MQIIVSQGHGYRITVEDPQVFGEGRGTGVREVREGVHQACDDQLVRAIVSALLTKLFDLAHECLLV